MEKEGGGGGGRGGGGRWKVGLGDFVGSPHPQEMHRSQEISGFGWSSRDLNERTVWNFVSLTLHS